MEPVFYYLILAYLLSEIFSTITMRIVLFSHVIKIKRLSDRVEDLEDLLDVKDAQASLADGNERIPYEESALV